MQIVLQSLLCCTVW